MGRRWGSKGCRSQFVENEMATSYFITMAHGAGHKCKIFLAQSISSLLFGGSHLDAQILDMNKLHKFSSAFQIR